MSKIRVLPDHVANQIAAGEVVERPASVAKELVENAIDAGARRIAVDVEAGGRRLLRVTDDGEGMTRDDAILAFERHATSKLTSAEDLATVRTLGFRGEALASIASVARVELLTQTADEPDATRVLVEGGRMRDVLPAAHPRGTTLAVRDLFFNVPARRKFLRSEATESFHLTNLITHYALAHPEVEFLLTNNGREVLRAAPAANLRERAYQLFGAEFIDNLLEVSGGHAPVTLVRGYVSAPRERRTTRDAQYLFVNGRYVRDRLVSRALGEGYRSVLPHGVYPAALLFLEVPLEEVDVNVHPAKTEVRFRRAAAVADVVREAVRAALATGGYVRLAEAYDDRHESASSTSNAPDATTTSSADDEAGNAAPDAGQGGAAARAFAALSTEPDATKNQEVGARTSHTTTEQSAPVLRQETIEFGFHHPTHEERLTPDHIMNAAPATLSPDATEREAATTLDAPDVDAATVMLSSNLDRLTTGDVALAPPTTVPRPDSAARLPPLNSAAGLVREVLPASLSHNIRPLGQLEESFIIATDDAGLLLIDQHVAHERILFDKYRTRESERVAESQHLLVPETFDLTPAQAAAFDAVSAELEAHGFGLMRLSGRTVAIKAVPADLPAGEARNLLAEVLDAVDAERRGRTRSTMRDEIAASLACHAAIKINTPLAPEKMRWLIDRLLTTSSPTTCPHGRPILLRLTTRDIERGFHRP